MNHLPSVITHEPRAMNRVSLEHPLRYILPGS